jgi:uncharacterized damage-inducible protein DinB
MQIGRLMITQARANRLANRRLHAAMAGLGEAELAAPRTSFFPSLAATLNHILAVDIFYIAALYGEADMEAQYRRFVHCRSMAELAPQQARSDERLIALCESLRPGDEEGDVLIDRGDEQQQAPRVYVLQHLFMHQTHHRGQVHAMLAGTAIAPPQLDEFLLPSDAALHAADLAALDWRPAQLFP